MRKYITEYGISMVMTHIMMLQQDDLDSVKDSDYFDQDNPCHIYFVCKRPRVVFEVSDFEINNSIITLPFVIQDRNSFTKNYISTYTRFPNTTRLICDYPYNFFKLEDKDGEEIVKGRTALLFQQLQKDNLDLLNLEVLYIGQSYGNEGSRTAPDRLKNHSTLQGIYSNAINRNPDSEIWLLLTSFYQNVLISMDGGQYADREKNKMDDQHRSKVNNKVFGKGLNEQQVINFTEAALIRYFEPPYNKEYKNSFPNPSHSFYAECYNLDINTIIIEMETNTINCQLFSDKILPTWFHFKEFPLHSNSARKGLFDLELGV